jgi:hypothetical protein
MAMNDEIAESLPMPPRPAPARRAAALELALRRFDGEEGAAPVAARTRRPNRYYFAGALVSAALVALVALPVTRETMRERPGAEPNQSRPGPAPNAPPPAAPSAEAVAASADGRIAVPAEAAPPATAASPAPARITAPAPAPPPAGILPSAEPVAAAPPPPPPPPEPPPPAVAAEDRAASGAGQPVVTGSRARRPNLAAPDDRAAARSAESAIAVSGSRIRAPRGDWNACTLDDPARSLSGCRSRAGAGLAEGLGLAWQGDLDGAVAALDRAVAQAPRSSLAYLNRGMAYRRKGNLERARADLDRAVRLAPDSARALYQRSLLRRAQGDEAGARADAQRALAIDPAYAEVLGDR